MRSASYYALITGCALLALSSCGPGGDCGPGMICPSPIAGYAQVNGRALRTDGTPIAEKNAIVNCGGVSGTSYGVTDAAGNFEVRLQYSLDDTLADPHPPLVPGESFTLSCQLHLSIASDNELVVDPLLVQFAPAQADVVPTVAELREAAPVDVIPEKSHDAN